jgi:hypothetical protein
MKNASELQSNDRAIIIIGDPGTRKTTLCLHFPSPYFLDCDGNLSAPVEQTGVREFFFDRATHDSDGTPIHPIDRFLHCVKCLNEAVASTDVKTVIIDSLTSFTDIILSEVRRQEYGAAATTETAKNVADAKPMRIQDWGKFAFLLKNIVTKLRTCGKTVVFTAHNNFEKDEVDQRFKQFINVPGQSKSTISGLFTDCWHTFFEVKGVGAAVQHEFKVRTLPVSDTDHRGVKSSFKNLKRINTFDEVIAEIKKL